MPSAFKQTALSFSPQQKGAISRGTAQFVIKKRGSMSPVEFDRIADDYIDNDYLDNIYDRTDALEAVNSLVSNPKRGQIDDFRNLLRGMGGSGKEEFADFLLSRHGKDIYYRFSKLERDIKLKSGRIVRGFQYSRNIYVRAIKTGLRAFNRKNNTFKKIPKRFYDLL